MRSRLEAIDALRGLAALFVVVHHALMSAYPGGQLPFLASPLLAELCYPFWYGRAGVLLFLVVSGFVLYHPIASGLRAPEGYGRFMLRRAWRIVPPYYAAIALSLLLIALVPGLAHTGTLFGASTHVDLANVASHLAMVHNLTSVADSKSINYPLWTIPLEFQLYATFPLWVLAFRRFGIAGGVMGAIALTLASRVVLKPFLFAPPLLLNSVPGFASAFVLGMGAASLVARGVPERWIRPLWLAGIGLLPLGAWLSHQPGGGVVYDTVWALGFASLILASSHSGAWLRWPPLVAMGRVSYSTYLVHAPLLACLCVLYAALGGSHDLLLPFLLAAGLPLVGAAAYAFHRAFEKPFLGRPAWLRAEATAPLSPAA